MGVIAEQTIRLTEPGIVPDIFVSGLGEVEDLGGGCFRFVFYARHKGEDGEEMLVVAKLIAPMEAVPPALFMAARAIGFSLTGQFVPRRDVN
jgi:hypothetical protein